MSRIAPIALVLVLLIAGASSALAGPIFTDDFESGISNWTGKGGGVTNGQIVDDPLDTSLTPNQALNFSALNSSGDIFTSVTEFTAGTYTLTLDYLGYALSGSVVGDFGGYVGISSGLPDTHEWLIATGAASGADPVLVDDGAWDTYSVTFTASYDFHLMLEDFSGSGGVAKDAFFDNISLTAVPEPSILALLGLGLGAVALGGVRRRRRRA